MKQSMTGGAFLARKSELAIKRQSKPRPSDILIIEDNVIDAERLTATLRSMFGYDLQIRTATTLAQALDSVIERRPDLIFLDDHLKPRDTAADTIPFLRRCNYEGPIIVVSGVLNRRRSAEMANAGAIAAIHKDGLDSGSIEEALAKVYDSIPPQTA